MSWLRSNVWEIQRSRLLSFLGAILSLLHVINYFYWVNRSQILNPTHNSTLMCWDFTRHCGPLLNLAPHFFAAFLTAYLALSCFAVLAFISRRLTGLAWAMLFGANLIKLFFYLSDASLAIDVQALLLFINFGFLFVPSKAQLARFSILIYYFVAGLRELSPDWLTGKALQGVFPLSMKGLEWVAAFGIIARWTLPLLLLSPIGQHLAIGVIGLLTFHIANFYFRSDYESVVMGTFVIFFLLDYFEQKRTERESLYQSYALPEPSKLWWPVFVGVFIVAQIPAVSKESALQFLKVEGPAAIADCVQITFANYDNRIEQLAVEAPLGLKPQLKCMARIAYNSARGLCHDLAKDPSFRSLSTYFLSRGLSEARMKTVFAEDNICADATTTGAAVAPTKPAAAMPPMLAMPPALAAPTTATAPAVQASPKPTEVTK